MKRRPTSQRGSRTRTMAPFQPFSSSDRETLAKRWSTAVVALENAESSAKRMATDRPQKFLVTRTKPETSSVGKHTDQSDRSKRSDRSERLKQPCRPDAKYLANASCSCKPASSHRCPHVRGLADTSGG